MEEFIKKPVLSLSLEGTTFYWVAVGYKFNLFSTNAPLLYPLAPLENLRFSDLFGGYRSEALLENGLI